MSLLSLTFVWFCLFTILAYFIVRKKIQWLILLISSWIFLLYDDFTIGTLLQVLIVLFSSYGLGILINKHRSKAKIFLILGILIIIGQLFYLKYTNLFIETLNYLFDLKIGLVNRHSVIGISYYSLMMIGYLVDVYR